MLNFLGKIVEFYSAIAFFVFLGLISVRYDNHSDSFTKSVLDAAIWPVLAYEQYCERHTCDSSKDF